MGDVLSQNPNPGAKLRLKLQAGFNLSRCPGASELRLQLQAGCTRVGPMPRTYGHPCALCRATGMSIRNIADSRKWMLFTPSQGVAQSCLAPNPYILTTAHGHVQRITITTKVGTPLSGHVRCKDQRMPPSQGVGRRDRGRDSMTMEMAMVASDGRVELGP